MPKEKDRSGKSDFSLEDRQRETTAVGLRMVFSAKPSGEERIEKVGEILKVRDDSV